MVLGEPGNGRWERLKARLRDLARLPMIVLVVFASAMTCWLGMWAIWRACEYVFVEYLKDSWVP